MERPGAGRGDRLRLGLVRARRADGADVGLGRAARVEALGVAARRRRAVRRENERDDEAVQTEDLSEDENNDHADKELRSSGKQDGGKGR